METLVGAFCIPFLMDAPAVEFGRSWPLLFTLSLTVLHPEVVPSGPSAGKFSSVIARGWDCRMVCIISPLLFTATLCAFCLGGGGVSPLSVGNSSKQFVLIFGVFRNIGDESKRASS
jgi:hypothetical protein